MRVDFLFQHAEIVPHHHNFMEEDFQRDVLGLQCRVSGMHDQFAAVPADAELFHHGIRLFQTEPDHGGIHGLLNELFERKVQAADGGLRFGGFEAGGLRRDGVLVVGQREFPR